MAPVVLELRKRFGMDTKLCVTGQHRGMLDGALGVFSLKPDFDLAIMRAGQTLGDITIRVMAELSPLLTSLKPDRVLVHGDTTTAFAASLACFYEGIPVGHVEAGLRTGNIYSPWPEEFNRRSVDLVADLLWAPTDHAACNLRREGANPDCIIVTGNTAVDAIMSVKARLESDANLAASVLFELPNLNPAKRLLLVTGHRRESFGAGIAEVCHALNQLAMRDDVEIVWPVHPNPTVLETVQRFLKARENVHLIKPVEYLSFVALMIRAHLIITDSGGIQEEAPSLSKPVLVTRYETERPEAVASGTARLIGTSSIRIVEEASILLEDSAAYDRMVRKSQPFGDGCAAVRIADSLMSRHGIKQT